MKQQFHIEGMTCATCQVTVQRAVSQLPGIKHVQVNLITHAMQVESDEPISPKTIIQEVNEAGYGAQLMVDNHHQVLRMQTKRSQSLMKRRLIVSFLFLIPLFYVAMGAMIGLPLPAWWQTTVGNLITQWVLATPILIVNYRYFSVGLKRLWRREPNMDSLVAIGTGAAFIYGLGITLMSFYGVITENMDLAMLWMNQLYLESGATILTLVTLGKYLEEISKQKTLGALEKLMDLKPKKALKKNGESYEEVPVEQLKVGDVILVKPGELIAADGVILTGDTMINQAAITGESLPVHKQVGDAVIGATLNQFGVIEVEVKMVGEESTLAKIIRLVEEASLTKAPLAKLADQISAIFVPIVIGIAILTFVIWLLTGSSLGFATQIMISILVISCPCALGLATPVTMMVGTGKGAELGMLIKSAEAMEKLAKITTIVMDKTGTITTGKPVVVELINMSALTEKQILHLAGSIEYASEHPLARAIVEKMGEQPPLEVKQFVYIPGLGVRGQIDGETYRLSKLTTIPNRLQSVLARGQTVIEMNGPNGLMAYFVIADAIKPTSPEAIQVLKKMHKRLVMLTGDLAPVAQAIATDLGISEWIAEVLPQEKDGHIQTLQKQGESVLMIGDGINDAPSLTRADVGMAIGAGTDIAIEAADIVLLQSDLRQVAQAIRLSQAVVKNMKTNLFWAFIYNLIAIPVAAGILYPLFGWLLSPILAALAMALSSVSVVLNALRLRTFPARIVK